MVWVFIAPNLNAFKLGVSDRRAHWANTRFAPTPDKFFFCRGEPRVRPNAAKMILFSKFYDIDVRADAVVN